MTTVYNIMRKWYGVDKKTAGLAVFILLLAASASPQSLTFGSITDVKQLTINNGEQKAFKVSFLNMGGDSIEVKLVARYMSDIRVEISPPILTIYPGKTQNPSGEDKEWLVLSDGRTYVETKPVYIYVKVPEEVSVNSYKVLLTATAKSLKASGSQGFTQQLYQTREIVFDVYVPGELSRSIEPRYYIETNGTSRVIIGTYTEPLNPRTGGVVYGTASDGGQDYNAGFGGGSSGESGGAYIGGASGRRETVASPGEPSQGQQTTQASDIQGGPSYLESEGSRPDVFGDTGTGVGGISDIIGNALKNFKADELSGFGIIPLLFIIAYLAKKISKREEDDSRWKR